MRLIIKYEEMKTKIIAKQIITGSSEIFQMKKLYKGSISNTFGNIYKL